MSHGSESGSAGGGAVADPALLECDRGGRVLRISEGARAIFGEPENLVDALWKVAPSGAQGLLRLASCVSFTPVFQRGDSVWISTALAWRAETAVCEETRALADLQCGFVRHYFRLQNVERALSTRTRSLRGTDGAQTVLQVDRERQRLGRELHTSLGQMLAAIRLQLEVIASQATDLPVPIRQALDRISTLAAESLEYVRSVASRLHPPEWQRLDLPTVLGQLWDLSGVPQRFQASLRMEALPREPALETRILMYRGAQEALSNLTRHSHATSVEMTLRIEGNRLILTFADNGVGFDADRLFAGPASLATGIGLRSIREQAAALGGGLIVQSSPKGTKLEVWAPFSPGKL